MCILEVKGEMIFSFSPFDKAYDDEEHKEGKSDESANNQ
jgi:hypothetical protein